MEAASARYAARDRWADASGSAPSQLIRFIQAACSPENYEPNLALSLEIADLINSKKGTAPREAAMAIVNYINHRNANVALLALNLLDICVKNCGYPFHLQISTKDFLNELVRRFPERPPIRPNRVQMKILEAIEEWRSTLCETSRYKEDLGFIRDMHRLLSYKGYMFPEVRRDDAAVLNPSDNLKSAEEMEEEEREAQSAKLQELIRRGTPEDLQEANRLMKIMAGYDTRSKVDYRAKAAEEVSKIQAKARILEERLEAFKPGDTMHDGDVFEELASALSSAQPKIQKMCEEESEDHEAVAKLLEINDSIHRTVERYKLMKKGDIEGANKIARGVSASAAGSSALPSEPSLIDFDDTLDTNGTSTSGQGAGQSFSLADNFLDLSIGAGSSSSGGGGGGFGQTGGIALGFGANTNIPGPALLSSMTQHNSAQGPVSTAMTNTISPPPQSFSPFSAFTSAPSASQSSTPQPLTYQSSMFAPPPPSNASTDPFAALTSPGFPSSKPTTPTPAQVYHPPATTPAAPAAANNNNDDDDWAFSSALPPEEPKLPTEARLLVTDTGLRIELVATRRVAGSNSINLALAFSNNTAQPISELQFETAVPRTFVLQLQPQTGRGLAPRQARGVTQSIELWHAGDRNRKVESFKLRWRVAYKLGGEAKLETGSVPETKLA